MANYDVIVDITDATAQVSTVNFGLVLIVSTDGKKDYKEYDISGGIAASGISVDYAETTATYKKADTIAAQSPRPQRVATLGIASDDDLEVELNKVIVENSSFFRVLIDTADSAKKLGLAKWCAKNKKFAYLQYDDLIFTEDYTSTAARLLYHTVADEHLDAAEAGYMSARIPGSTSFKFRTYKNVSPSKMSADEISQAETKNMGYYIRNVGIDMQRNSRASNYSVSKPMYMDDLESREYTSVQIANNLLSVMVNVAKLTGDTRGLQLIDATISQVLLENYGYEIIAATDAGNPDFEVDTTRAKFDKSERSWKDIKFGYAYAHPTEKIYVTGIVR